VLNLDVAFDINQFDPTRNFRRLEYHTAHAYGFLTRFKSGPDVKFTDLILQPDHAESWTMSPDGKAFTFNLRKGIKFHNVPPVNGREFTSKDVKFSLEYISRTGEFAGKGMPPAPDGGWMLAGLQGIDTPDDYTAVVQFQNAYAPFINYTATAFLPILPREVYDRDGDFQKEAIGSGPFYLDKSASQPGTRLVWKKHASYWQTGQPHIDEVHQLVLPDPSTAYVALQSKQLDMLTERLDTSVIPDIIKNNPDAQAFHWNSPGPYYFVMEMQPPSPFADIRVRQAVNLALNRDEIINTLTNGQGAWALAGAFPDAFTDQEIHQILKYDPDQAKQLLADAGYSGGLNVEFMYPGQDYGQGYVSLMQLMQSQWAKVGINVSFKSLESGVFNDTRNKGQYQMAAGGAIAVFADPDSYLFGAFHSSSGNAVHHARDPKLDQMIEAQRSEPDPTKRTQLIRDAVQYINTNVVGLVATHYFQAYHFAQSYVKDFYPNWGNPGTTYTPFLIDLWLDK
jgi:peptide/nickel transport system substrate-binding protein